MTFSAQVFLPTLLLVIMAEAALSPGHSSPAIRDVLAADGQGDATVFIQKSLSVQTERTNTQQFALAKGNDKESLKLFNNIGLASRKSKNFSSLALLDDEANSVIAAHLNESGLATREMAETLWRLRDLQIFSPSGPIGGLMGCLKQLPEDKRLKGMLRFVIIEGAPTKGGLENLGPAFFDKYVQPPFEEIQAWATGDVATAKAKVSQALDSATFESTLDGLSSALNGQPLPDSTITQIIEYAWGKVSELANLPNMEMFKCSVIHVLTPMYVYIKPKIGEVLQLIEDGLRAAWDALTASKLGQFLTKTVSNIQESVDDLNALQEETSAIAKQAAEDKCQTQMHTMKADLDAFVDGDTTKASALTKIPSVASQIIGIAVAATKKFTDDFLGKLRSERVRPTLEKWVGVVVDLFGQALHAIDGLCGLIPEVGAAICAFFTASVNTLLNRASETLIEKTMSTMFTEMQKIPDALYASMATLVEGATSMAVPGLHPMFQPLVPFVVDYVSDMVVAGRAVADECDNHFSNIGAVVSQLPA